MFKKKETQAGKSLRDKQIEKELDNEALTGAPESVEKILKAMIAVIATCFCLFQIYTAATMPLAPMNQRAVHYGFALALVFLFDAMKRRSAAARIADYLLALVSVALNIYIIFNWLPIQARSASLLQADLVVGFLLIAVVIYSTYRTVGIWMPLIAVVFLIYAAVGKYLPGALHVSRLSLNRFVNYVSLSTEGIFGTCLGTSATFAFMFILFAEFLVQLGAGDFIIKLAEAGLGTVRGGPAKIAVGASGLFGSVSGSAVANVAGTGCMTIPMMKKYGFKSEFSGGVVAAASTGGAFMPPVMGTVAFIMADLLSVSYREICIAAVIPAVLYYLGIFITVDCEACKLGMKGVPRESLPRLGAVFRAGWHYLLALVVLVVMMVVLQWSASKAALYASATLIAVDLIKKLITRTKIEWKIIFNIFTKAAKGALTIATATACAGIIVGVFTATGLNLRFSSLLVTLAGNSLFLLLILVMIGAVIMGMGLPTTPVYIILAVLMVPAMTKMGVLPIAAHMFVLYYGVMAAVTPPVGLAFYVASGIAEAPPMKTGLNASKIALIGFILPFIFVYNPGLLLQGPLLECLQVVGSTTLAVFAISFGLGGYCMGNIGIVKRILFGIAAVTLAIPESITDVIGLVLFAALVILQFVTARKVKRAALQKETE